MELKFYRCPHCGNIVVKPVDSGVNVVCCGAPMEELIPFLQEELREKHLPVVTWKDECTLHVEVGSTLHPMLENHHIAFICVEFENGYRFVGLKEQPIADICVCDSTPKAVYEYCNLHGLWKVEVPAR
ncbi:MAG: desulfoferrodoxin [Bacteroidales bacterium]|nr:desulfoferrodoxin [Bacteroidales bacterium]